MALAAVFYLANDQRTLGSIDPTLFTVVHASYFSVTLVFIYLIRLQKPTVAVQFYLQNYLDILFIAALMYSSGGANSGISPLLLVNLALLSQLSSVRNALLFAAISSMIIIVGELFLQNLVSPRSANFEATALLGALLFLVAWLMTVPLRHLIKRQLVSSSHSRAVLDVSQLAQLNEEIIRELDSGVVVTDRQGNVQLINDTARTYLAAEFTRLPVNLRILSKELLHNLQDSERSPTLETRPVTISSTSASVLPHYIRLSSGGVLIRLDDHAHIRQQFQQLKLASLGRLSASIAHEIRNPLGAIHHAVQLIEESKSLDAKDLELLDIAKRHTGRINRIIEDILQLSNRQLIQSDEISIDNAIDSFVKRFLSENNMGASRLKAETEPCRATIDPEHLDQILWNLCTNAQLHNQNNPINIVIKCWFSEHGTANMLVVDDGKGISQADRINLFEPFFSTHHEGTGLGLFIIRELCELNHARIECLPTADGAHFHITFNHSQDMAA